MSCPGQSPIWILLYDSTMIIITERYLDYSMIYGSNTYGNARSIYKYAAPVHSRQCCIYVS